MFNTANKAFQKVNNTVAILDIVKRVAMQRNILGINATIQAVHAGEYGRGLSVVATEVRKSDESSNSVGNSNTTLNEIRNSVEMY